MGFQLSPIGTSWGLPHASHCPGEGRFIDTGGTLETITGWIISTAGDSEDEEGPETKQQYLHTGD